MIEMRPSARRGTTNRNVRGNAKDRLARRLWLVATYAADETLDGEDACRCYRCGALLVVSTVTVDRIVPGCRGGTYRRDNIRPACSRCNTVTGASTRRSR